MEDKPPYELKELTEWCEAQNNISTLEKALRKAPPGNLAKRRIITDALAVLRHKESVKAHWTASPTFWLVLVGVILSLISVIQNWLD